MTRGGLGAASLVATWLLLLSACSSRDDSTSKPSAVSSNTTASPAVTGSSKVAINTKTIERFCQKTYSELVAKELQSCSTEERATDEFTMRQQVGLLGEALCAEWMLKAVAKQRVELDPTRESQCSKAMIALGARKRVEKQLRECEGFVVGLQKLEQPCAHDFECEAGLHCFGALERDGKKPGKDGLCKKPAGRGEACGKEEIHDPVHASHPTCQPGLSCDEHGETSCREVVPTPSASALPPSERVAGLPCDDSSQCAGRCSKKNTEPRGVCVSFCGSK